METAALRAWEAEHGHHPYAKARDELARALQCAEGSVNSGEAVLDMVADVFGLARPGAKALEQLNAAARSEAHALGMARAPSAADLGKGPEHP